MKKFRSLIIKTAIALTLLAVLVVFINIRNNPDTCEAITRGFARFYGSFVSKVTSIIPFSLTEVFFVILGVIAILLLISAIINLFKIKPITSLCRILDIGLIALTVINLYHLTCQFSYNRQEMPLPLYEGEVNREEHVDIYNYFADDLNDCIGQLEFEENGDVKTSMSLKEVTNEVKKAYEIITDDYFHPYFGGVKGMFSSFIYREFQITGVTFAPFAEANINTLNTKSNIPLTVAHELAHTKGVMREDDANKLAFYVCLNSEHPYLRYCAYVSYFSQIEGMVTSYYLTDEERNNLHHVDSALNKTRSYEYKFWKEHDLLGKFGDWINNLYIKSSGVKEGTSSYSSGTEYTHDPTTTKLIPSLYQKMFFEKYYRLKSI